MIYRALNKAVNKVKSYPIELQILIIASIGGLFLSLLSSLVNFFLNLGWLMTVVSLSTGFVASLILYFVLIKKKYKFPTYLGIFSLIFMLHPALWFLNAGSKGPTFFFMLFNAPLCAVLLNRFNYRLILGIQIVTTALLVYVEYRFPMLIMPYNADKTRYIDLMFSFTMVFLITFITVVNIMKAYRQNIEELRTAHDELLNINQKLKRVSETDELTGLYNRRHIMTVLRNKLEDETERQRISIIMIDIDHFKYVNDTFGHSVGDEVIIRVGHVLKKLVDQEDIVGRIGGEEFLILLSNDTESEAIAKAEKLRKGIYELNWKIIGLKITISGGIYISQEHESLDRLLVEVDQRLYKSKRQGRNQMSYDL